MIGKHSLIYLFLLLFSSALWAMPAVLTPMSSENNRVEEGKIFEAKLSLEGEGTLTEADFAEANKASFSEQFFFLEAEKISEREFKLRLLLKQTPVGGDFVQARLGTKDLELKVTGFYFTVPQNLPKDFIIQDQKLGWGRLFSKEFFYGVLTFVLLFSYPLWCLGRRIYLKNKLKREKAYKKEYWQSFFYAAQTREQFEEIALRRKEWIPLLNSLPEECQKYFAVLEEHQYKKHVSEPELKEIKQALNGMKDVLERFGV